MPKRKRKLKQKRRSDSIRIAEQVNGCIGALFRVLALVILWMCLISIGVIIYLTTVFPAFDPTVWIAISGLFAYLSSYFAFASDDDTDEKPKNKDSDHADL